MFYDFLLAFLLGSNNKGRSFDRIIGIYIKVIRDKGLLAHVTLVIVVGINVRSLGRVVYVSALGVLNPVLSFVAVVYPLVILGMYAELIVGFLTESVVVFIYVRLL